MKTNLLFITLNFFIFAGVGFAVDFETAKPCSPRAEAIHDKISTLGQGTSFTYVDLELTDDEWSLIEKLKFDNLELETTQQYDRFGNLHLLKDELPIFLREIGNDDEEVIQAVTEIITRLTDDITKGSNKKSAWVCIRASTPNHDFDIPRWHTDGQYFGLNGPYPYPGIVFKFGAVLKGPSTLLYNLPEDMREIFNSNWDDRLFLSELLDLNAAESPKKGQGVFFIVADEKIGAVHSEPKMDENRLFFSVLVGDDSEIEELYTGWHPKISSMGS